MPYTLALNDVVEVKFYNSARSQQSINVLNYQVSLLPVTGVTDQDVADALSPLIGNNYKNMMEVNASYRGVRLTVVRPNRQPWVTSVGGAGPGAVAGDALPAQSAGLLSYRTAVVGRRGRGRTYFGFASEASNDAAGKPTAGYLALLLAWSNTAMATINVTVGGSTASLRPVILSRDLPTIIPVTTVIIRAEWATQRRRSQIGKADTFGP